jgi:hypothetical protein
VESEGSISSGTLAGLQAMATNGGKLGMTDALAFLTTCVVNDNAANAHYQGQALGDLQAGSSPSQLQLLVNKWFLGLDQPALGTPAWNYVGSTYITYNVPLFKDTPSYLDVFQGGIADCGLIAPIAEVATKNPSLIENMFIDNGDGTFTLRLFPGEQAEYVTVDRMLPTGYIAGNSLDSSPWSADVRNGLWVALIEKAFAQMNEWHYYGFSPSTQNSYDALQSGFDPSLALGYLTGQRTGGDFLQHATPADQLQSWSLGRYTVLASQPNEPNPSIVGFHAYAVVGYDAATGQVTLFNPWGIGTDAAHPGLVTLSLSQLSADFEFIGWANPDNGWYWNQF